jgi:glycerophosphoryl diester phosphodiesterase
VRRSEIQVIAHRTCPLDAPENSLQGIARAAELGADAVELDVRLTRDGVPVLSHDRTCWRVARRPWPVRLIGHERFTKACHRGTADHLPALRDALDALPAPIGVAIDLKDHRAVSAAAAVVRDLRMVDRAMLWARTVGGVREAQRLLGDVRTALLRDTDDEESTVRYVRDAHACGATSVSIHQDRLTARVIDQADRLGILALAWVVERQAHERVLQLGVTGVVTDWPALARELVS